MIEGRMLIPTDVFTTLCVELARTSDAVLIAARKVATMEGRGTEVSDELLNALMSTNNHISNMEGILKAVMEENPARQPAPKEACDA